ncbi:glycosyltransferase [Marinomonas sp. A79]|uniref:Glycosyltransferase n=1 Tax=Marinomonas vulgaris TaxID=2823372 RepID=A0ABS5HD56_9GAMM|nr:glycosyltransferase [Marinomonas vulgaris]MBR7889323.1 glycosyltransferase [Marinomonas vulgaris]
MTGKVSIVIPTYNGLKYIEKTINSCLEQSYQNIEVIVVDDFSTDATRELLLNYKGKVKLLFNDENLGIVKSVNKGVSSTNSEFFILLGHDDLLPEKHVELMLSEFESNTVSIHCNSILIDAFGDEKGFSRNDKKQENKTKKCLFELSIDNFISSCGMLHRKSVFDSVGGWDEGYLHYGEWLYYIKSLKYGDIKYTTKSYAYYRRHTSNITNTFRNKEVVKILNNYKMDCRKLAHSKKRSFDFYSIRYMWAICKIFLNSLVKK